MIVRALVRFVIRTRWSSSMAMLGMMLGITSIVAVHLVSVQVAQRLDALVPAPLASFDYLAHKDHLTSADYFRLLRSLPDLEARVDHLTPVIDENVIIGAQRLRVVGVDFLQFLPTQMDSTIERELSAADLFSGALLGKDVADMGLPVLGRIDAPGVIVADIGTAQTLLGWAQSDRLSYLGVQAPNALQTAKTWMDRFFPGASAGLPEVVDLQLPDYRVQLTSAQHPARSFGDAVLFNISALGGLALVVAWFLIYQVAVFWVRRLQGVFDRLFIVGVDEAQLLMYFVALLVTVGLLSTLGGIWLGWLLAGELLRASVAENIQVSVDVWVIAKALFSALAVCVVGGVWAFNQILPQTRLHLPGALKILLLAGVLATIVIGVWVPATDLVGGFLSIALLSILLALCIGPVLRLIKRWSRYRVGHHLLRMSLREVIWFPRDLAIALAGLSLAIASAIGVGLMVDSFRTEFKSMLDQRLSYDFVVQGNPGTLSELYEQLSRDPQITRAHYYQEQNIRLRDNPMTAVFTELDAIEAARYGYAGQVAEAEVLISEQLAGLLDLAVGSKLELNLTQNQQPYTVVHIFKSFGDLVPRLVINPRPEHAALIPFERVRMNGPAASAQQYADTFTTTAWQDQRLIYRSALHTFDQTFVITSILIAIAIGVGGIGVFVAVTVLRLNQRASERLLSFMGLRRREILGIDLARGAGVGAIACGFAVPLGLAFGWILCTVINPRAFGWVIDLQVSPQAVAMPIVWGMLAALLAGLTRVGQHEAEFGV